MPTRDPATELQLIDYDTLCDRVELADLWTSTRDAIAYVSPAGVCHPDAPLDLGGILDETTEPTSGRPAWWADTWWAAPFQSLPAYAALLHDALCVGGLPYRQHRNRHLLLVRGRFIVPDSYLVRGTSRSLPTELILEERAAERTVLRLAFDPESVTTRRGLYYLAGAAWDHFGHFLLEGLARWWLLARLPESVRSEVQFVVYNDAPLESWQLALLQALGVSTDRLVYLTEPARFERMIVPSIGYNLHCGAAPAQIDTWQHIGRALDRGHGPARVYLSRSRYPHHRSLVGEDTIERQFEARGFTVLHPQLLDIADQVASIRHARLIAGSGGSAMYLSAFARPGASKLIIASRSYAFRDDQLISYLRDERLAYFLCPQEDTDAHPRDGDYQVDPDRFALAVDRWIAGGT